MSRLFLILDGTPAAIAEYQQRPGRLATPTLTAGNGERLKMVYRAPRSARPTSRWLEIAKDLRIRIVKRMPELVDLELFDQEEDAE